MVTKVLSMCGDVSIQCTIIESVQDSIDLLESLMLAAYFVISLKIRRIAQAEAICGLREATVIWNK